MKNNGKYLKIVLLTMLFVASINQFNFSQTDVQLLRAMSSSNSQTINVAIGGNFITVGSFGAQMNERVDQFITRIYNEAQISLLQTAKSEIMANEIQNKLINYGLRDIKLKRISGETLKLDLLMFRTNGDYINNPYLKNDDVIIFPPVDMERSFLSVEGAVNLPGKFQFVEGDNLQTALELANGIHPAYENVNEVVINRLSYDGEKEELLKFKITDKTKLYIGDRIKVRSEDTGRKDLKVFLSGEVHNPGYIHISKNNTTLRDVINRAGGFKPNADLNRSELIRGLNVFNSLFFSEEFENLLMSRMSNISDEDSAIFFIDNKLRFARGNGIIDFAEILKENSIDGNFLVQDGDVIVIPAKNNLVYVYGQVKMPGYIEFHKGESLDYYIAKSGGKGELAKDEVYLIKGKSRSWSEVKDKDRIEIEEGDYIWIPKVIPRTFDYYLNRIASFSSVIGTIATIILIILQIAK
ncbi:MAG: SLBB domain-containing protein [Ignavibacteria bacterium]|nr:SLBB domain-containing protein [Ignavibacteria bacterium]